MLAFTVPVFNLSFIVPLQNAQCINPKIAN